jgi:hypothetical protein
MCGIYTQRIALPVFAPSLMQYLSIRSKKHADKILCPMTGEHKFPSKATYITSKLWKKFQAFKVHRLLLSYCEASQHVRKIWADAMEFFHSCGKNESFGEAITRFRAAGLRMNLARSATVGILIPTRAMMRDVENNHFETFAEEESVWRTVASCMSACIIVKVIWMLSMVRLLWRISSTLWRVSYVSPQCPSKAAKWYSFVTAEMLTKTMRVCIQGCCPCYGIRI